MKKLLALAAVAGGVLFVVKRKKAAAKAEADLWREATAPSEAPFGVSSNGTAPAKPASSSSNAN